MGTLYNQPVRSRRYLSLEDYNYQIRTARSLATQHNITIEESLIVMLIAEIKRGNELFVDNGDTFDEQMAGIGEELQGIKLNTQFLAP